MAHKKAGGSSRNGRDSAGRRLGIKKYGGEVRDTGQYNRSATGQQMVAWQRRRAGQRPHDFRTGRGVCHLSQRD